MRWKKTIPQTIQFGQSRIQEAFLFFPLTIGDETRWLEKATWTEIYRRDVRYVCTWWEDYYAPGWTPLSWINP